MIYESHLTQMIWVIELIHRLIIRLATEIGDV